MADSLTDYQKDILIKTALGEARGEGVDGMSDVIQVILNRANSGRYPSDPAEVALQPNQFSTWNTGAGGNNPGQFNAGSPIYRQAERALEAVIAGDRPDYTGGALFYHTPAVSPNWANSVNRHGTIERNGHVFYPSRPVPPGEIPNVVASQLDTQRPRVAPSPLMQSQDLSQLRNPIMSSAARNAQVTPSADVPLPRARPSAPDIVNPSIAAALSARPSGGGNVNATRAVDMLAATPNAVTPRLAEGNDNIYSYHIPDMTPTVVTGGMGSLTPSANTPARQTAPTPTRAEQRADNGQIRPATQRQIDAAPSTTVATIPTVAAAAAASRQPQASPRLADASVRAAQSVQRPELQQALDRYVSNANTTARIDPVGSMPSFDDLLNQMGPVGGNIPGPNAPPKLQDRLASSLPGLPMAAAAPARGTPIMVGVQQAPVQPQRVAPMPIPASMRPVPQQVMAPPPIMASAPLRITVNGGNVVPAQAPVPAMPSTAINQLRQNQGLTAAQAYDALNRAAAGPVSLEDRLTGRGTGSSSGASAYSIYG